MSELPDPRMAAYIHVDIYNLRIAVFRSEKKRLKTLKAQGCNDLNQHVGAALSSAHRDFTDSGEVRLSMVIKPAATRATWAHECSHIADFILDYVGIPLGIENTESRAYLVGHIFQHLENCEAIK